jgi:hypothetical protein
MDLKILLDDLEPDGSWNETIYPVSETGEISDIPVSINNTEKLVAVGTNLLKIPENLLTGEPKLTLSAVNAEESRAEASVTLKYVHTPVVTIEDPSPITNSKNKFIYVDLDFDAADSADINGMDRIRVVFKIDQSLTKVLAEITSEGESLTGSSPGRISVHKIVENTEADTEADLNQAENGLYAMYIPNALMKGYSSREIKIKATDLSGNSGETTVTLLRRSLFPLD